MGRACSRYGEMSCAYSVLVGKPEGRRPLETPRRKWEDNIKMDFRDVEWTESIWLRKGTCGGLL
jgi:hypothetical protein